MAEQTISAEKLAALTGYTDRRHRQLASAGYFPPPVDSQYQLVPTIQGLFRYFRQRAESTDAKAKKLEADTKQSIEAAKLKRSQRMEMDGTLIPPGLVDKRISDALLCFRQWALSLPQTASVQVNPNDPQLAYNVLSKLVAGAWESMRKDFTKDAKTNEKS